MDHLPRLRLIKLVIISPKSGRKCLFCCARLGAQKATVCVWGGGWVCVCPQKAAGPVLSWDLRCEPGGKDPLCLLPSAFSLSAARNTCPTLAPPRPACAPRPRPDMRMRPGTPPSRTSARPPGARVRAPVPFHPHSPLPPDLLFCFQAPPPASSPATRTPPSGPLAFHLGPRSTPAGGRRVPGRH